MPRDRPVDAWILPPAIPAPSTFQHARAGGLTIRYPQPDHDLAGVIISSLRDARRALATFETKELVAILGGVGERFARGLDDRRIGEVAANADLSPAMAETALGGMTQSWTTSALDRLVRAEFRDPGVLDGFVARDRRSIRAASPGVSVHFGAGSVPGVTVTSMVRALLVRSPVLVKPGAGDVALTVRFARALHRADSRLAAAVAVCYWPGGAAASADWEREVLARSDQVVVYGGQGTIESIRARAPATTRLVEHPHSVGVAIVDPGGARDSPESAARAVAMVDQKGCVSTHLILLLGGAREARRWCGQLADRLAALETSLPPAAAPPGQLSAIHQLRGRLAVRSAASQRIEIWSAEGPGWTVILAGGDVFEPIGSRTAWVVPVRDRSACLDALTPLSRVLQTVGLAGPRTEDSELVEGLAALGATRIVPLDQVSFPDTEWLHDGRRPLGELVRWAERR
ncbi:MAG: hypothetical protein OXE96_05645 [Gemmatimonadetes bacterium]|nr:hypothetical protein [Gemmatimonadota bacterium]